MNSIKILIADDHPLMREALQTAMADEADMLVVGEAQDGNEAIHLAAELMPDVILMDLLMPGMDGLEAIARLQQAQPHVKILVVTSLEDEQKVLAAIQAGAIGYFPKTAPRSYLLEAIRKAADGIPYLPSGIALKLFKSLREMKAPLPSRSAADEPLTIRQQELLALIGEGRTDAEIATILHVTEATVRSHVHNILQRLGLETRAQATAFANRGKLGQEG
jgi:two-component system, NarL family, response regulator LiaR